MASVCSGNKQSFKELLDRINFGLNAIEHDGTRRQILTKWKTKEVVYLATESVGKLIILAALSLIVGLIFITFKPSSFMYMQEDKPRT